MELTTMLVATGSIQGMLLAIALWLHPRGPRRANRIIAVFLVGIALALFADVLRLGGHWQQWPTMFVALSAIPFLLGPLLWLYVETLTNPSYRLRPAHLLHGLPWLLNLVLLAPLLLMAAPTLVDRLQAGMDDTSGELNVLALAKALSLFGYTTYAWVRLRRWQRSLLDRYSNLDRINLRWLAGLLAVFLGLEVMVGLYVFGLWPHVEPLSAPETAASLVLTGLVLATGVLALRQPEIFSRARPEVSPEFCLADAGTEDVSTVPKSMRNLAPDRVPAMRQQLDRLMRDQRLYLDRDLSLAQLAAALSASPHQVSELLNVDLGCTFYDFINRYRVENVQCRLLAEPNASVLDLALEAGFNNKATFNKAFRRFAGCTPSAWRAARADPP
jgi:AraC-like DNA-binding protein